MSVSDADANFLHCCQSESDGLIESQPSRESDSYLMSHSVEQQLLQETGENVQRRRRTHTVPLPRVAISFDSSAAEVAKELSPVEEKNAENRSPSATPGLDSPDKQNSSGGTLRSLVVSGGRLAHRRDSSGRSLNRSVSAQGLHLVIPTGERVLARYNSYPFIHKVELHLDSAIGNSQSPASSTSSRDTSPNRREEMSPVITQLKPPVVLRRGNRGFGFTVRAIRVYLGESEYYTLQHIITVSQHCNQICDLP